MPEVDALEGYEEKHVMSGKGKGVSIFFSKKLRLIDEPEKISLHPFQIIKVRFCQVTVIVVYRSPQTDSHVMMLESLMQMVPGNSPTIICGDINTDPKHDPAQYNKLITKMASKGFVQIIDKPTHLQGGILDHMYIRNIDVEYWQLHHPYYTDHDAICMQAKL